MSHLYLNTKFGKKRIFKNLAALSFSIFIMFTAYEAISILQSTINNEHGIGVASQAVIYAFYCVSSLFFAKYTIRKLGCKPAIAISLFTYCPYMAANFYPHWITMVPTSVILGLGAGILWSSINTYLSHLALIYTYQTEKNNKRSISTCKIELRGSESLQSPCERKMVQKHLNNITLLDPGTSESGIADSTVEITNLDNAKSVSLKDNQYEALDLNKRKVSENVNTSESETSTCELKQQLCIHTSQSELDVPMQESVESPAGCVSEKIPSNEIIVSESGLSSVKVTNTDKLEYGLACKIMLPNNINVLECQSRSDKCETKQKFVEESDASDPVPVQDNNPPVDCDSGIILSNNNGSNNPEVTVKDELSQVSVTEMDGLEGLESDSTINSIDTNQVTKPSNLPTDPNLGRDNNVLDASTSHREKIFQSTSARFFGLNGMAYLSTNVMCFLLAYCILETDSNLIGEISNSTCTCGSGFCNVESDCFKYNILQPSTEIRYTLAGCCLALGLLSSLLVALLLDPMEDNKEEVSLNLELLSATFRLMKKQKSLVLTPWTFFIGMIQAFYVADFTKSYVACSWGTYHVGLVTVCYGSCAAVSSTLSGYVLKHVNRLTLFMTASFLCISVHVLMLVWNPDAEQPAMFFIVAGIFGSTVGIFWSQYKAFYGGLFRNETEAAFSNFCLWNALGHCVVFGYSDYLCTSVKIYLELIVFIIGIIGYILVEPDVSHQRQKCLQMFNVCSSK